MKRKGEIFKKFKKVSYLQLLSGSTMKAIRSGWNRCHTGTGCLALENRFFRDSCNKQRNTSSMSLVTRSFVVGISYSSSRSSVIRKGIIDATENKCLQSSNDASKNATSKMQTQRCGFFFEKCLRFCRTGGIMAKILIYASNFASQFYNAEFSSLEGCHGRLAIIFEILNKSLIKWTSEA